MDMPKRAAQSAGAGVSSDAYLKIGDGEKIDVVFRGSFYEFWQNWPKGGQKQIFTEPTAGARSRFLLNAVVYDKATKKFVAKVWEFAFPTYNQLAAINEHYPLEKTKIQITRTGAGTKTSYVILPLGPVVPKALKEIEAVELNVLDRSGAAAEQSAPAETDSEPEF